jgi:hypothetical protein
LVSSACTCLRILACTTSLNLGASPSTAAEKVPSLEKSGCLSNAFHKEASKCQLDSNARTFGQSS